MKLIRCDVYGGYAGEKKPDPDHCYSWTQHDNELPQEFALRISEYIMDMCEELDVDSYDE